MIILTSKEYVMNMSESLKTNNLKVYVLAPNEDWIVDRFVQEWNDNSGLEECKNPLDADVIWILADWAWKNILNYVNFESLKEKIVVTTVHHIVPGKFGPAEQHDFALRDMITDYYHVYNENTQNFISKFTKKPIRLISYWANDSFWNLSLSKIEARSYLKLNQDSYLIGSFQRDTEGHNLVSPKLEKGPDLFCDYVEQVASKKSNIHVLLGGWRRQYVIKRLEDAKISYTYFERPPLDDVRKMYRSLDHYVVSARCEGGPQALIETGLMGVPCISRDIGIARQVLPEISIKDDLISAIASIPKTDHMHIGKVIPSYVSFFKDITNASRITNIQGRKW